MTPGSDRCEAIFMLRAEGAPERALQCTRDRRHVDAPIGWVEPGPVGRRIYLTEEARPHSFKFEVALEEAL